jgi:hypothetical protein
MIKATSFGRRTPTSSFLPKHTASHPADHSTDTICCEGRKSSHTPYHSAPPSTTITTVFTPLGQRSFRKASLSLPATTGCARTEVLTVGRPCVCFLELSPVRGATSAPRVADGWTRGAAGKSKYSENDLSHHHFFHHKSHAE